MNLILILGDQLSESLEAIQLCDKAKDRIFMFEVMDEANYVKHHKQKLVFVFSSMRHFAKKLQNDGFNITYVTLDDRRNTGSLTGEMTRAVNQFKPNKIVVTFPGEYRILEVFKLWEDSFKQDLVIYKDNRFLMELEEFSNWASSRKQLRMEYFYREVRKKYHFLMEDNKPIGGKWNFDSENRKALPKNSQPPQPSTFDVDQITLEVMELVKTQFASHFGDLEHFSYAVTREQALSVLNDFIDKRLCNFGDYQDAMHEGNPWLFHSHIALYLNIGLLRAAEVVEKVEQEYKKNDLAINSVEGFIRQIIGWREYIRGFYWYKMPSYKEQNYFSSSKTLPDFYWTGETAMNCVKQCVTDTKNYAYAHHIQRLMVLGNFALLADINPKEVSDWFLLVYADAYEWVELPNVFGMAMFADGGGLASKPYISSGAYINRMSNYCKNCDYKVSKKEGQDACPFNYLYWNFLDRHKEKLSQNPRMGMPYRTLQKMSDDKINQIRQDSKIFLTDLD